MRGAAQSPAGVGAWRVGAEAGQPQGAHPHVPSMGSARQKGGMRATGLLEGVWRVIWGALTDRG